MKRLAIITICILIITLLFSACSNNIDPAYIDAKDGSPLMIYIWDKDEYMKYHIDTYNSLHDETQIEYEAFSNEYLKSMYYKMKREIEEGKGPDLILIDNTFFSYNDIYEMTEDVIFADMDKLISRSQLFDSSKYNMNVLDTGIINETRVFVPVSYTFKTVVALKKNFDELDLEVPTELTLQIFLDTLNSYYENTPEHSLAMLGINLMLSLSSYINDNKQIEKLPELDELIKVDKQNFKRRENSGLYEAYKGENFDWFDWCFDNDILFTSFSGSLPSLYYHYNLFKNKYNSDLILYNYPISIKNVMSSPDRGFAISVASDKKNRAFKFIDYMLSEKVQSNVKYEYGPSIPVNLDSYELEKEKFINGDYDFFIDKDIEHSSLPPNLVFQFIDMVENAECEFNNYDYIYYQCYWEPISKYLYGQTQLQYVIDEINDNLYKYYNEDEEE